MYRIRFQMRVVGKDANCLAVHWNGDRTKVKGTPAWAEYTLTVKATGKDVLKFQRVSSNGSPCLDAISVELATP